MITCGIGEIGKPENDVITHIACDCGNALLVDATVRGENGLTVLAALKPSSEHLPDVLHALFCIACSAVHVRTTRDGQIEWKRHEWSARAMSFQPVPE